MIIEILLSEESSYFSDYCSKILGPCPLVPVMFHLDVKKQNSF